MKELRKFSQSELIDESSLGICTRITFKWLALEVAGGEFKFEKLNVKKSAEKMAAYGDPFIQKLCSKDFSSDDRAQAKAYIQEDLESTAKFVNFWGQRVVDAKKKEFKGIAARGSFPIAALSDHIPGKIADWKTFHAIYSFYMKLPASVLEEKLGTDGKMLSTGLAKVEGVKNRNIMAGHTVGISGSKNQFFDSNFGLYEFAGAEPAAIASEIDEFVKTKYGPSPDFSRVLTVLGM